MERAGSETLVEVTRKHWAAYFTVVYWKVYACPS